jgi:3-deoxy-D-manno-oct-2-ulosonic acid (Kdo) hydroxylase
MEENRRSVHALEPSTESIDGPGCLADSGALMPEPINMTDVVTLAVSDWDQPCAPATQQEAVVALEAGSVVLFPQLSFPILADEARFLTPAAVGQAKNVSFDPASGTLRGSGADAAGLEPLRNMMSRFAKASHTLLRHVLPRYAAQVQQARTSYRPAEIAGRVTSWRKDDTRLHVDSFPSSPTHGTRILRVFSNVNPHGCARTWRLGEPFEAVARRFVPSIPGPIWLSSHALSLLGITKSRRSAYDHYMLRLHDRMKADLEYQSRATQGQYEFSAGNTWIVFTDQVSHAAIGGQYALEQTFHLPVRAMHDPSQSPLKTLERLVGRALV